MTIQDQITSLEKEISEKKKTLRELRKNIVPDTISDYPLKGPDGEVLLSDLFGEHNELLLIFNMGKSCSYCTLWADNFNGINLPLQDRSAFCVVSPDTVNIQQQFAESRNWQFPLYSHEGSSLAEDLGYYKDGGYWPGAVSLSKDEGGLKVHSKVFFGPGDNYCNMWDFLDILPQGTNEWKPKYIY